MAKDGCQEPSYCIIRNKEVEPQGTDRRCCQCGDTESVLVFGHKIQGVFKEYSSTKNCVFKEYSKQVYIVLHYVSKCFHWSIATFQCSKLKKKIPGCPYAKRRATKPLNMVALMKPWLSFKVVLEIVLATAKLPSVKLT